MAPSVWGTFSVRDHCRPEAFLREILLFDKLAVPYPDRNVPGEWDRWLHPNVDNPAETWDPVRLDLLLGVLGSDEAPGYNGARCAQLVHWSPGVWKAMQTRLGAADAITGDPFMDTRLGIVLGRGQELPGVIEAVAAYPSAKVWHREVQPELVQPPELNAAEALVALSRPLLMPESGANELDNLRRAVDLAMDDDYASMRSAYHEWFRDFIEPLRPGNEIDLTKIRVDPKSLKEAEERLRNLWSREKALVSRLDRDRTWSRVEAGCMSLGTAGTIGLACAAALPALGAGAALLAFAGWAINKWRTPKPPRSLGGASMFVEAHRKLDLVPPANMQP